MWDPFSWPNNVECSKTKALIPGDIGRHLRYVQMQIWNKSSDLKLVKKEIKDLITYLKIKNKEF